MGAFLPKYLDDAVGQFYTPQIGEDLEPFDILKPNRNLIAAIILRAIEDAYGYSDVGRKIKREAKQWIIDKDLINTPFTFSWCCNTLKLNPDIVRKVLREKKYHFEQSHRFRRHSQRSGTICDIFAIINS